MFCGSLKENTTMFSNYLKVALRNLLRHRAFAFINIFGLAVSMSVCLLAIMLIKDAYSFDLFHKDGERTYRILTDALRKSGGEETYASSPHPIARDLYDDFSYAENWVPLVKGVSGNFRANGKLLQHTGLITNASFFEVFGFQLATGNPVTALSEPFSVILKKEIAEKYFGGANPIGQILENESLGNFKVTGVLASLPGKTHLEFDMLVSYSSLNALEATSNRRSWLDNWHNYYSGYNFLQLKKGVNPEIVEAALAEINQSIYTHLELETRDRGYRFRLQPLNEISPGQNLSNSMGGSIPIVLLWFLSALGTIVMVSACFNYTNLTVARSLTRAQEIGVRKVLGASKRQISIQFLSEAVLTALLSLVLAYCLLKTILPSFLSIGLFAESDISLEEDPLLLASFLLFAIGVGLIAGLLPSIILSRFSPLSILQKLENHKIFRRVGFRKVLIVGQFTVSLIFILLMTIIWRQTSFSVNKNFASDRNDLVNIQLQGQPFERAKSFFAQIPGVQDMSGISHLMGTWQDSKVDVSTSSAAEKTAVRDYFIDHQFIENFGLEIIAGDAFTENASQQQEVFAMVNEKFLERFDLGEPIAAIGKPVIIGDSTQIAIKAVVKDFLFKPLNYSIEPLLLRYDVTQLSVLNLQIGSGQDRVAFLAGIERAWHKLESGRDLAYEFYDETAHSTYAEFFDMLSIVGFFGILGLIIATLGILGMAIYTVETRVKEVSIRKIIGASVYDLIYLLSKGYIWLLIIALILAIPISLIMGNMLLQTFSVTIPLNIWVILPGVGLLILLGAGAIGSQTVRAALANPADNLKSE